jgi:hypothetical protein
VLWGLLVMVAVAGIAVAFRFRLGPQTSLTEPLRVCTVARFRGPEFARAEAADDENPQFWGEALLRKLLGSVSRPFEAVSFYAPSYGHAATLTASGHKFTVAVGFVGNVAGADAEDEWLLFVDGNRREPGPTAPVTFRLGRDRGFVRSRLDGSHEF